MKSMYMYMVVQELRRYNDNNCLNCPADKAIGQEK